MSQKSELKQKVFDTVNKIPLGGVVYFGQIASQVGSDARTVGWILSGMVVAEYDLIPWYRVVSKNGYISSLKLGHKGLLQKQLLLKEGYIIIEDCVDMKKDLFNFD
jgi:alkylated DNA nucleotide flippase Atl1